MLGQARCGARAAGRLTALGPDYEARLNRHMSVRALDVESHGSRRAVAVSADRAQRGDPVFAEPTPKCDLGDLYRDRLGGPASLASSQRDGAVDESPP